MKYFIIAVVVLIIGAGIIIENRYDIKIHSPIVAKLDRFTGDVYIANAGSWRKVQPSDANPAEQAVMPQDAGKAKK